METFGFVHGYRRLGRVALPQSDEPVGQFFVGFRFGIQGVQPRAVGPPGIFRNTMVEFRAGELAACERYVTQVRSAQIGAGKVAIFEIGSSQPGIA